MPPEHKQPVPEQGEASGVTGYRVVVEVALHDRFQPLAGLDQGIVHSLAELRLDALELRPHALADRLASNCKPSQAVLPTDVGKAQEIERLGFPFSPTFPVLFGVPPEFDPARLIRVKFQTKLSQSFPKIFQKAIRVRLILESRDAVIGISDDYHFASRPLLTPDVPPEIESVV